MTYAELKLRYPHMSETTLRLNATDRMALQPIKVPECKDPKLTALLANTPKKRLRQKTGEKLNDTEKAFFAYLCESLHDYYHCAQAVTLLLANGVRYTPDFASFSKTSGRIVAHEVKGFMRDDAGVKLKVAASVYPAIHFHLVTKRSKKAGGGWDIQEILP
jgi:hypothetical protein